MFHVCRYHLWPYGSESPLDTFMSSLDGNDEVENVERSNRSVPTNTHLKPPPYHTPPNYL